MATFGENLRRIREASTPKVTQEELARRMGYKRPAPIAIWETHDVLPKPEQVLRAARALGCRPAELLAGVRTTYDRIRDGEFDGRALPAKTKARRKAGPRRAAST